MNTLDSLTKAIYDIEALCAAHRAIFGLEGAYDTVYTEAQASAKKLLAVRASLALSGLTPHSVNKATDTSRNELDCLSEPALVGSAVFGKGTPAAYVVQCAQRHYALLEHPTVLLSRFKLVPPADVTSKCLKLPLQEFLQSNEQNVRLAGPTPTGGRNTDRSRPE